MPAKLKLTYAPVEQIVELKRDGLCDADIIAAIGVHHCKAQMNTWGRELGIRVHAARKAKMRRLSYEWLAGLREIVIDSDRCPLTFAEFTLKEFERDKEGNWIDEIPDGNDHSIDAVRYAMLDDMLRG